MGEDYPKDMLKLLEANLNDYDKILFFETPELIPVFNQLKQFDMSNQKILVLSTYPCMLRFQTIMFKQISKKEAQWVTEFYFTYEFSNKFLFIPGNDTIYANLHHMVKMGILTSEECCSALIC